MDMSMGFPWGSAPSLFTVPDAALIDAFERKERRAADELYVRLVDVVEGTLRGILGMHDEHHRDLVQAAFEQILKALSRRTFARRCGLASWASSVTAHVAFNAIRARMRERRCIDRWHDGDVEAVRRSSHGDLERAIVAREELAVVGSVLAEMSSEYATTLFLHDVLGHELSEIAAVTGTSFAAAQSRLVRGRSDLRGRMKKRRSALRAPSVWRSRSS
jgi:RNA polymerase sigma factor (sigma-70 family)